MSFMTCARSRTLLSGMRLDPLAASQRCFNARAAFAKNVSPQKRSYASGTDVPTEVEKILLDTIKATGPISFATYMQMCLSHPIAGYYMKTTKPVIGSGGDFITSPEISQVFGELLGVWLLSQWMYAGGGREIRLLELGPGQGTLMHDVLRVFSQFPAARSATKEIHLVETSQAMRSAQEDKLSFLAQTHGWKLHWHDGLDQLSHDSTKFTLALAHEFFDALPFHLIQKTDHGWQEVLLDSGPDPAARLVLKPGEASPLDIPSGAALRSTAPRFRQVLSRSPTPIATLLGLSSERFKNLPLGSRIEVSQASFKVVRQLGELLRNEGEEGTRSAGSALIVDYGGDKAYGNSFRAFKDHKIVDPFHRPGECDLTVNVDFAYLKEATTDLVAPHGPVSQAIFLHRMGLRARLDSLKASAKSDERKQQIEQAAKRLVDPTGMGTQYQIMALTGKKVGLTDEEAWPFVQVPQEPAPNASAGQQ